MWPARRAGSPTRPLISDAHAGHTSDRDRFASSSNRSGSSCFARDRSARCSARRQLVPAARPARLPIAPAAFRSSARCCSANATASRFDPQRGMVTRTVPSPRTRTTYRRARGWRTNSGCTGARVPGARGASVTAHGCATISEVSNGSACCTSIRSERTARAQPQTAVDHERDAGDERGGIGTEEQGGRRDFVDRRHPAERTLLLDRSVAMASVVSRRTPSVPSTGPGARPLTRTPAGPHSAASARVSASMPAFAAEACDWPIVPRSCSVALMLRIAPPCALQMRKRGARHVEGALQIDVHDGAEPVRRKILGQAHEVSGGAVDEDVEPAEGLDGARRRPHRHRRACGRRRRPPARARRASRRSVDGRLEVLLASAGDRHVAARPTPAPARCRGRCRCRRR